MKIQQILIGKNTSTQMVRYFLCGCSTTVLCWGTLLLMTEVGKINYMISANSAALLGYIYSYLINKYMVFKNYERAHVKQGIRFIVLQVGLWIVSNGLLYSGVEFLHIHYFIMIIIISAINVVLNFVAMKTFIFNKQT